MSTLENKYDTLENLIYSEGISIRAIDVHKDVDLFLFILNTSAVFRQKISNYKRLKNASQKQLENYQLVGKGTGIHWPELDEDLSLKGILRDELKSLIHKAEDPLAA